MPARGHCVGGRGQNDRTCTRRAVTETERCGRRPPLAWAPSLNSEGRLLRWPWAAGGCAISIARRWSARHARGGTSPSCHSPDRRPVISQASRLGAATVYRQPVYLKDSVGWLIRPWAEGSLPASSRCAGRLCLQGSARYDIAAETVRSSPACNWATSGASGVWSRPVGGLRPIGLLTSERTIWFRRHV